MAEFVEKLENITEEVESQDSLNDTVKSSNGETLENIISKEEIMAMVAKRSHALEKVTPPSEPEHKFWSTQPVPRMTDIVSGEGPIDPNEDVSAVRQEPYAMPAGFEWCSLDVMNADEVNEMYKLLNENYVEDDECMFRFDYSIPFLQWALTPPGYLKEWHVGVRSTKTGKLMACITACPAEMRIVRTVRRTVEINYLCVHKKLRSKRLAPVLIKEVTRRVNLRGCWQAVYTAGILLPKPMARCRYWHRNLNPKKLIEVNFTRLKPRMTMARTLKLYKLPDVPASDLRTMEPRDVSSVTRLLNTYLSKTNLAPIFTDADTTHWLLPRDGVINSFVLTDKTGNVTDFCSYYHLPSTVIGNPKHKTLKSAYSYYNVATTMSLVDLMRDSLIFARNCNADVFNALDLMDNATLFEPLKFGIGDGHLQYYVYNWKCVEMVPNEIGLVLL
mmetsp:Transcript_16730/g.16826  ORF Transcript_16730/g.16826 Transcript_16730/m.16826 type:complete len:445 (+) Transcript_16730:107-1441(+)|eukprot:CAMPEP_0182428610 /NCGR_PEP_ID=MMETSP1167-20130531/23148_1 /TAXON_ID=2988 /ORGANISM="Mallomonas Sp, Strain CCMP3275" /LENGTH=444 /DNA_ID=CAMNT_0024611599 /DNA_START=102 /DNA_END=1436 /DNA_ORIENTATION=-